MGVMADRADFDALAAFLDARLDEEEAAAQAATNFTWTHVEATDIEGTAPRDPVVVAGLEPIDGTIMAIRNGPDLFTYWLVPGDVARYMSRQNPAVTLTRVKELRAILALHRPETDDYTDRDGDARTNVDCDTGGVPDSYPCATRLHLARVYRVRPDGTVHPDWIAGWGE